MFAADELLPLKQPDYNQPSVSVEVIATDQKVFPGVKQALCDKLDEFVYKATVHFSVDLNQTTVKQLQRLQSASVNVTIGDENIAVYYSSIFDGS